MANSETRCCIVGGGPAGVMLGYLLARSGVNVVVLEKHKDFFRDFRGDTVHPSTLEVMHELGLLRQFLQVPHQKLTTIGGVLGDYVFRTADFRHLPTQCKFVALMPQWDFLDFLSGQARQYAGFELRMEHEVFDLVRDMGRIAGVKARTPQGEVEVRAHLVVGCDGRHSVVRQAAQMEVSEVGVPIDVLWFRISRRPDDPDELFGNINYGKALILINRGEYFQAGLIIRKGSFEQVKQQGLEALHRVLQEMAPYLGERPKEIDDWDKAKLLTVQINRLQRWYRPGLLCIGDAAHAMSPAGGVGINLAIQDAVATANLLSDALQQERVTVAMLDAVQQRREFPTRVTQAMQERAHKVLAKVFAYPGPMKAPWQFKLATRIPGVQRVVGRAIGLGVRPEHIRGSAPKTAPKAIGLAVGVGVVLGAVMVLLRRYKAAVAGSGSGWE